MKIWKIGNSGENVLKRTAPWRTRHPVFGRLFVHVNHWNFFKPQSEAGLLWRRGWSERTLIFHPEEMRDGNLRLQKCWPTLRETHPKITWQNAADHVPSTLQFVVVLDECWKESATSGKKMTPFTLNHHVGALIGWLFAVDGHRLRGRYAISDLFVVQPFDKTMGWHLASSCNCRACSLWTISASAAERESRSTGSLNRLQFDWQEKHCSNH